MRSRFGENIRLSSYVSQPVEQESKLAPFNPRAPTSAPPAPVVQRKQADRGRFASCDAMQALYVAEEGLVGALRFSDLFYCG